MKAETPFDVAVKFEKELTLPNNFFMNLLNEDDWSFIIKLHAIFEAAATFILVKISRNNNLETVFSNLELSKQKTGKLAFLKAYDVLDADESGYISLLSELRNLLVHNIKNVNFNIETYIGGLDSNQRRKFIKYAGYGYHDSFEIAGKVVQKDRFVADNPKLAMWQTAIVILGIIYMQKEIEGYKIESEKYIRQIYELKSNNGFKLDTAKNRRDS